MPRRKGHKSLSATQARKREHLELCLNTKAVTPPYSHGLERYGFVHNALPEIDFDEIDLSCVFLGKRLQVPLLISSMTGGFDLARKVNRNLAKAAQTLGVAMGVGSQRVALEDEKAADSFQIRDIAPEILLLGNLGAVQLNYGYDVRHCRRAVEMIRADGLILHLNALQEATQPEGNRNFKGLEAKIAAICEKLDVPVVIKEVGSGISGEVARRLHAAGVKAVDVAGRGGTSWYAVEAQRSVGPKEKIDTTFLDWGIPTGEAVADVRRAAPNLEIIASGGIRTGLDVAKSIALGADLAALGQPLLQPALKSAEKVIESLRTIVHQLKVTMLCVGARDLAALRGAPLVER
jgi:isopentenyl-diphosphate delta-isomerase